MSRSEGRNAIAAAAYRAAERLDNPTSKRGYSNFTHKAYRTLATKIYAPDHAPEWAKDRGELWANVERSERRKDSRLAVEIEFALPYHIPKNKRQALIDEMAQYYVSLGYVVDMALHTSDDGNNPHVHMMLTTRAITSAGFSKSKIKGYDQVKLVYDARKKWEEIANVYLASAGSALRVDRRSHAERGRDQMPSRHRGADPAERAAKRDAFFNQLEDDRMIRSRTDKNAPRANYDKLFHDDIQYDWPNGNRPAEKDMSPNMVGQLRAYEYAVEHREATNHQLKSIIDYHQNKEERARAKSQRDITDPRQKLDGLNGDQPNAFSKGLDRTTENVKRSFDTARDFAEFLFDDKKPPRNYDDPELVANRRLDKYLKHLKNHPEKEKREQFKEIMREDRERQRNFEKREAFFAKARAISREMDIRKYGSPVLGGTTQTPILDAMDAKRERERAVHFENMGVKKLDKAEEPLMANLERLEQSYDNLSRDADNADRQYGELLVRVDEESKQRELTEAEKKTLEEVHYRAHGEDIPNQNDMKPKLAELKKSPDELDDLDDRNGLETR